ncbi:MAG: STY4534 family ICE replication protein [Candidatus Thiodiazotropha sp.]
MSNNETTKYFDLHTTGIGYLNRVREVTPKEGNPFLSVTIAALRGSVDNVQYTHFECHVSGKKAQEVARQLKPAVEGKLKVLMGFTLSDLYGESFTFKNGDKAGETGVSLKARLLRVSWAKVDGQPFYTVKEDTA